MGKLMEQDDARRPMEFPRLSERYRANAEVIWHVPSQRRLGKGKQVPVAADLLDLSVAGALLSSLNNSKITVGMRMRFELNGHIGVAEVRNCRPAGERASYYGVSFFSMTEELENEIFDLVAKVRSEDLELLWQRAS
jgi:hypothetical protein